MGRMGTFVVRITGSSLLVEDEVDGGGGGGVGADQRWCAERRLFLRRPVMWCVWRGCGKTFVRRVVFWVVVWRWCLASC